MRAPARFGAAPIQAAFRTCWVCHVRQIQDLTTDRHGHVIDAPLDCGCEELIDSGVCDSIPRARKKAPRKVRATKLKPEPQPEPKAVRTPGPVRRLCPVCNERWMTPYAVHSCGPCKSIAYREKALA